MRLEFFRRSFKPEAPARENLQTYRIPGELEKTYPDIDPLPPTPITKKARTRMKGWGMSESHIQGLQALSSSPRYDLVIKKAERIAQNGGYITHNPDGTAEVILPDGPNMVGRGDGHCGAIAKDLLIYFDETGYLTKVNQDLQSQGKPPLEPCFVSGLQRTHFNQEDDNHVWVGLVPEGQPTTQMVTIDASSQEISTSPENKYQTRTCQRNISEIPEYSSSSSAGIGSFKTVEDGIEYKTVTPRIVLGASSDRELVYSLGFLKDSSNESIRPVLEAKTKDASPQKPIGLVADNGDILIGNKSSLTDDQQKEMRTILTTVKDMPLIVDHKKAEKLKEKKTLTIRKGK